MFRISTLKVLFFSLLFSQLSQAQIPEVPVLFPNNHSCIPGQLLSRQPAMGRVTNIAYHNGHIYTSNIGGSAPREFVFSDVDDPSSFEQVFTPELFTFTDVGTHGNSKIGDFIAGYWNPGYQRLSLGVNGQGVDSPRPDDWVDYQTQPSIDGSGQHRTFYPWATPFNWLQYGPTTASARLYRADQLLAEWEPLGDHSVAGHSILLGNMLFVTSDASMLGVAAYDISPVFNSPPGPPLLVDRLTGSIGGYLGAIWQDYLILAGGNDHDIIQVVDISDVTNMRLIASIDVSGDDDLNAGSNVPYVQTQDNFIFARRHKIDMELLQPVLELDEVGDNRPLGSVSGAIDTSQYLMPLGNLLITGSYSSDGRDAIGVWCQEATPDTRAPYVGYHIPNDGQTNFPLGAPISIVIAEELESFTIVNTESIIVRPVGGAAIDDAWISFSHDGILTYTPKEYLLSDTTYEVIIPTGGIKDISGNGIEGYAFTFSTGSNVGGGNSAPEISSVVTSNSPANVGQTVTIETFATDQELDDIEYRFIYGDGTPASDWSSSNSTSHTFNQAGHFNIKAQVRDIKPDLTSSVVSDTYIQTIIVPPSTPLPVSSSMLSLDEINRVMWVVNPDNNSVSRINANTENLIQEINLMTLTGAVKSIKPLSVAVDSNGNAWITARNSNQVLILNSEGTLLETIETGYGSRPQAVLISRDGTNAFVSLEGRGATNSANGQIIKYNTSNFEEVDRLELGRLPRAMAITGSGDQIFVAPFISGLNSGTVWNIDTISMTLNGEINLGRDRGRRDLDSGGSDGPGVPNYIADLVISPDHDWLWYTAIKTDTNRGEFFAQGTNINLPFTHDSTIRSMLGRIDLNVNPPREPESVQFSSAVSRVDIDNTDSPSSITFSPNGDYAFVTLQGNNTLAAFDDFAIRDGVGSTSIWRTTTGSAPQASFLDSTNNKLWVKNLMSRDLSIINLNAFIETGSFQLPSTTTNTVETETLNPDVFEGKKSFYFAGNDPIGNNEMSFEGYISCASCHIDGSHDGRTWDFTQRGEGFRNTTDLRGRRGTGHGNVHWSANFDEIQDFVLDMVNHFGGLGFLGAGEVPNSPLAAPNANNHIELDQLRAYVSSLNADTFPQSPFKNIDGSMSASALAGQLLFSQNNCQTCHNPASDFTNSELSATPTLHNVGTIRTSSGQRLNAPLNGIDTPTLLGAWESAPYFHDGSAETIDQVFETTGGVIIQAESGDISNGAVIPGFISINADSSSHGTYVNFASNSNATINLTDINGGSGGIGAIEIRVILNDQATSINLSVNGTIYPVSVPSSSVYLDWRLLRVNNVMLNSGTNNTISLSLSSNAETSIDEILVSTNDDLTLALPHTSVQNLNATDFSNLMEYILQLDGSESSFPSDLIFKQGFE